MRVNHMRFKPLHNFASLMALGDIALRALLILAGVVTLLLISATAMAQDDYFFECEDLHSGETVSLDGLAEELPLIVHVWGPDCPHCRAHMPYTAALYDKLDLESVRFVALSITGEKDEIMEYVEERELEFPILYGEGGEFSELFEEQGWPTTFVFAPGGGFVGWCDTQGPSYITEMLALVDDAGEAASTAGGSGGVTDGDAVVIERNTRGRSK
jgi:thiol-disulfide isomerase/thioredoxin